MSIFFRRLFLKVYIYIKIVEMSNKYKVYLQQINYLLNSKIFNCVSPFTAILEMWPLF